jgi:hypothetical protein
MPASTPAWDEQQVRRWVRERKWRREWRVQRQEEGMLFGMVVEPGWGPLDREAGPTPDAEEVLLRRARVESIGDEADAGASDENRDADDDGDPPRQSQPADTCT